MNKPKHTPGPWYSCLNASEPDQRRYIRSDNSALCPCKLLEYVEQPIGEFEANARLIAAAPELLEALQVAQKHILSREGWAAAKNQHLHAVLAAVIQSAIVKATGGAE